MSHIGEKFDLQIQTYSNLKLYCILFADDISALKREISASKHELSADISSKI
jgi:hypothetical protein